MVATVPWRRRQASSHGTKRKLISAVTGNNVGEAVRGRQAGVAGRAGARAPACLSGRLHDLVRRHSGSRVGRRAAGGSGAQRFRGRTPAPALQRAGACGGERGIGTQHGDRLRGARGAGQRRFATPTSAWAACHAGWRGGPVSTASSVRGGAASRSGGREPPAHGACAVGGRDDAATARAALSTLSALRPPHGCAYASATGAAKS